LSVVENWRQLSQRSDRIHEAAPAGYRLTTQQENGCNAVPSPISGREARLPGPFNGYRRCGLAWVNGDQIGVTFLRVGQTRRKVKNLKVDTDA